MLVLSRKTGQRIVIGDSIEIVVLSTHGGQVSLGITAPPEVAVHRKEILDRILDENVAAASSTFENCEIAAGMLRKHPAA